MFLLLRWNPEAKVGKVWKADRNICISMWYFQILKTHFSGILDLEFKPLGQALHPLLCIKEGGGVQEAERDEPEAVLLAMFCG